MKVKLRSQKLLERQQHHPIQKKRKDLKIVERLLGLSEVKKARVILFYLPINGEVDLATFFTQLQDKKRFVLARVKKGSSQKDGGTLDLYSINHLSDTEMGSFKILEPKKHLKKVKPGEVDLALIPGVAFGKDGHRIGYGMGFFDRLLPKLHCPKIGVAYEFQIVENVEGQAHDIPMDMIVTEQKTINL